VQKVRAQFPILSTTYPQIESLAAQFAALTSFTACGNLASLGRGAYFENPSGIANIFTRVTGGNPSNILGNLGVLGNSNLFLINPKGIVFGPQARLDVRGSFVGSSASGVVFNNGFEFSSANPQTVPLLAINIPVGLRFRENPGAIVNASSVTQVIQDKQSP
jgi:filamentous hemagglutinin family protein